MTPEAEAWRRNMRRRADLLCAEMGLPLWTDSEISPLMSRLAFIAGEGLTDPDLRVIVRLYNRELIGRRGLSE
jgi:hypothetical protein